MIKSDAIVQLTQLRDTMQEQIDLEIATIRNMPAEVFAAAGGYSLDSAHSIKSRFLANPPSLTKRYKEGHPLYPYSLALHFAPHQKVMKIVKAFAYPFVLYSLFAIVHKPPKYYTPQELSELIEMVQNCEYDGIGEIRPGSGVNGELWIVRTGDQCSWVLKVNSRKVIVKNDGGNHFELINTKENTFFKMSTLPYLLAESHVKTLGYKFTRKHNALIFEGK